MKYTVELLAPIVAKSSTMSDVCRALGKRTEGYTHTYIARRVKELGIDTSHMVGRSFRRGCRSSNRSEWSSVLVENRLPSGERSNRLRRALIESGRVYKCEECGCGSKWMGKTLTLHVDHKSGVRADNTPGNLRFLCPNCHSQTENFGVKNISRRGGIADSQA